MYIPLPWILLQIVYRNIRVLDKRIRKNSTIRIREMSAANDIPLDIRQHGDCMY